MITGYHKSLENIVTCFTIPAEISAPIPTNQERIGSGDSLRVTTDIERINEMQSAWDASAKYKYSEHSTIHNPQEIGADGNIHTWILELNGQSFRVTREVWEAYRKDNAALREAGEKMERALQDILHDRPSAHTDSVWENVNAAIAEWEAAIGG